MQVKFYDTVPDEWLKYAVVIARSKGKWVFCKHRERDTFEVPGGHREKGESIDDTARRELYEETGALEYELTPVCVYSVVRENDETFGKLYYAEVSRFEAQLHSEIEKIILTDDLVERWTYPEIQPKLIEEAKRRGIMVELRSITKENIEEVLNLNVLEQQKSFVSSTAYSLAQAYAYHETAFPFAIYADNVIVGFIMMGYYEDKGQYTLWKFLIDKNHQGKGYGKEALKKGIKYLNDRFGTREIYTGVALGNARAKYLYRSIGFKETGLIEDNMEEMKFIW